MKTVLSLHSQVAGARVGNSVAAFAMERLGVNVMAVPTVVYGRRPDRGRPGGGPMPASLISDVVAALELDGRLGRVDAVVSGYIATSDQFAAVIDAVDRVRAANPDAVYVCDPVIGDADPGRYVSADVAEGVLSTLVRHADWITPNAWELGQIAGRPMGDLTSIRLACARLGKPVLVSSVPIAEDRIGVLFAGRNGEWLVETPRLPAAPKGAGDLLTALFLARRLRGEAPAVSLEASVGAVFDTIIQALALESADLPLIESQDLLADPRTWPTARALDPIA